MVLLLLGVRLISTLLLPTLSSSTPERFGGGFKVKFDGELGRGKASPDRRGESNGEDIPFIGCTGPRPGEEGTEMVGERGARIPSESRLRARGRIRGR